MLWISTELKVRLCNNISIFEILKTTFSIKRETITILKGTDSEEKERECSVQDDNLNKIKILNILMNKYYNNRYKVTNGFESYSSFLNNDSVRKRYKDKDCIERCVTRDIQVNNIRKKQLKFLKCYLLTAIIIN